MARTRSTPLGLAAALALLLAGCSGAVGSAPPPPTAPSAAPVGSVVPTAWIDATTAAWPTSDGLADRIMVSAGARGCLLGDQRVRGLVTELRWSGAGFGPLVPGPAGVYGALAPGEPDPGGFVHRCSLSSPRALPVGADGRAAGQVVLTRYPDATTLQRAVTGFRSRPDSPVQDNETSRVRSGRYDVDALRQWFPTNPQGAYQAMVVDEPQRATLVFEINSLSRNDFEAMSAQRVADALADFLDRSHAAPTATPPPVPDWAGSVWQDAARTFHIAVATGWAQDPAAGDPAGPTTLARFRKADGSGAVTVLPTSLDGPQSLAETLQKARVRSADAGYTVVGDEPITLDDGRAAHRLDATHAGRHFAVVIVLTDTQFFQVIGSAPLDRWDDAQGDVLRMARSFVVEP